MTEPDADAAQRLLFEELELLEREMEAHYRWVYEEIAPELGNSVLEAGSGTGTISKFLLERGQPVLLTDYDPVCLARLRERFGRYPHARFQPLDLAAPRYDVDGDGIDTIVCLNVLEHIPGDAAVLRGFAGLLPPGGRLILQVPNHPALYGSLDAAYGHARRYTRRGLATLLREHGFEVGSLRSFNVLGIPGWFLSGKILRRSRIDPRAARLFNRLVPFARWVDRIAPVTGLGLIAVGVRR